MIRIRKETVMTNTGMKPAHPGTILFDVFEALKSEDNSINKTSFAAYLAISRQFLDEVFKGNKPIRVPVAARISELLGTSARMWLSMQDAYDLYEYRENHAEELEAIKQVA